jgi:inorganic pyrophosphatase
VDDRFWAALDDLIATSRVVIDRPTGSTHPRHPDAIYPASYGYLEGTSSGDGAGIDVWLGSSRSAVADAVACAIDPAKRDAEIKILIGCSAEDRRRIMEFMNRGAGGIMLVERPASS